MNTQNMDDEYLFDNYLNKNEAILWVGKPNPMLAAFAMTFSSVSVVMNSLRLKT